MTNIALPLFVKDPFFSLWAENRDLTKAEGVFWMGNRKAMKGTLTVNGVEYSFMGGGENALKQTSYSLSAFSTNFNFEGNGFKFSVEFLSPLPPTDLKLLSLPVCYLSYKYEGKEADEVSVSFAIEERVCYDTVLEPDRKEITRGGVIKTDNFETAYIGLRRQYPLSHSGDGFGADWGNYYLCGEEADVIEKDDRKWILATNTSSAKNGFFMLGYDDIASIYYYGEILRGYYFEGRMNILDALFDAYKNKDKYTAICEKFDEQLKSDAKKYGEEYYTILVYSLRQSIGAHKLVRDSENRILFLSKECNSDGCVATVDVTYPSAPLYLYYNPELVRGMLRPIFDFARMPIWKFDYAPHDAGVYPYVTGQLYAARCGESKFNKDIYVDFAKTKDVLPFYYLMQDGEVVYNPDRQMPVEESANVLVLAYACFMRDGDDSQIVENIDLLEKWSAFLVDNGPVYGRQLCTDDFAGHLDDNINLVIKASIGIECYAKILRHLGREDEANKMSAKAKEFAKAVEDLACKDGHLPIAIGTDETTFSLKYNLAFDKILGTNLYPDSMAKIETEYYLKKANKYGTPLDSRITTTKTDWLVWCAAMAEGDTQKAILNQVYTFIENCPDQVPFPDWYETTDASAREFRNRTPQGGTFIMLLK